jgi:hypothetical protein
MSVLITLLILAFIAWGMFTQIMARQQTSVSCSYDSATARKVVSECFGRWWTAVPGDGADNFKSKRGSKAPVISISYDRSESGGCDVDIWCSHGVKQYGVLNHAQLVWRRKRAVVRALAQADLDFSPSQAASRETRSLESPQPQPSAQSMIDSLNRFDLAGRDRIPHPQPPAPGTVKPLNAAEMAEYQHLLESALTGEEQSRLSPEKLQAYLDVQLHDVAMPSWQKPDINGLHEGDRVRLVEDFNAEGVSYRAGSTGTIIIPGTAPAQVRLFRKIGLLYVALDEAGSGPGLIRTKYDKVEKISGHADVIISGDGYVSTSNVAKP